MDLHNKSLSVQHRIKAEIMAFKHRCRTLLLATINEQGQPALSYLPFMQGNGGFYVLIAQDACQAHQLSTSGHITLMMVDEEQDRRVLFARKRLEFTAQARAIATKSEEWYQGIKYLQQRHGQVVAHIVNTDDFVLYHLIPSSGTFTKGFDTRFNIDTQELLSAPESASGELTEYMAALA